MEVIELEDVEAARERVVAVLHEGGLVVVPTDTVYGVVADAFQAQATQRIFGAKRQGREVPLGVVIRSPRQVNGLVSEVPEAAERLMASYWPGPLTLVFQQSEGLRWDLGDNRGAIGLRLPTEDLLVSVTGEVGPLACTAARARGGLPPTNVSVAQAQLGDRVALYVDGGPREGKTSTVVDVTRGRAKVLRQGAIPAAHIELVATGEVGWGQQPGDDEGV